MNIGIVHHLPPGGGAFRVVAEYVARSRGNSFTVYTGRQPRDADEELLQLPSHVPVVRVGEPAARTAAGRVRELAALPRRGRALAARVDEAGHDAVFVHASERIQAHEALPWLRTPSLYYAPEALRAAYESEPDFALPRTLRARLARRGLNPYERRRIALDRRHLRSASRVVTHSRFTAGALADVYGIEADVVQPGVDADAFAPSDDAREGYVLSIGALHPLKGHQFVIEAVAGIAAPARPPVIVVGDRGHVAGPLRELATKLDVDLVIDEAIPHAALLDRYRRAGVLACGQIREPFGLVVLEAMATATPVVAVDEGGFRETVRDAETGLLVARDARAFGAALRRVLEDPGLAERLGRAGRAAVEAEWTWDRAVAGFDRLLATVAEGSSA